MNPEQWLSLKWNGGSTMSDRWLNQSKIIHPLYFSRVFQKTKGISPSEYRKNISQRVFNSPSL